MLANNDNENKTNKTISIFPNPMQNTATLLFSNPINTTTTFTVYDVYGKTVKKIQIPALTSSFVVDRAELANGMYFYTIADLNNTVQNGKLILE